MDELRKVVEEEVGKILASSKTEEEKEKDIKEVIGSILERFKDRLNPENIEKITEDVLRKVKEISEKTGYNAGKVAGWVAEGMKDGLKRVKREEVLVKRFLKACFNSSKKMGLTMMKLPITFFREFMEGMKEE